MGMPKIEIAAVPLNQRFFNVMNLPVISDFINSSIKTAAKEFVAPSNYTLDLSKILVGEDTKKELLAIGVLVVHISCAEAIRAADINGKSDCYVTLSYSKYAKPLWSTRIIFGDLNPVWDETAVLLVNADEVKASEKLSVTLWDSDRFTADDIVGRTEVDVTELVRNRGQLSKRRDRLQGFKDGHYMPGHINWSVVFYGKRDMNQDLATSGVDERLPGDFEVSFPCPHILYENMKLKFHRNPRSSSPKTVKSTLNKKPGLAIFHLILPSPPVFFLFKYTTLLPLNDIAPLVLKVALHPAGVAPPTWKKRKPITYPLPTAQSFSIKRRSTKPV